MAAPNQTQAPTAPPTRFELELEFVSLLGNPEYLTYLATTKLLQNSEFIAYIKYLQYWTRPEYLRYLSHPGPTLRVLELLQNESFRKEVLRPEVGAALAQSLIEGSVR